MGGLALHAPCRFEIAAPIATNVESFRVDRVFSQIELLQFQFTKAGVWRGCDAPNSIID